MIVNRKILRPSATPTLTGAAFGAADAVGGKLTFSNATIDGINSGIIRAISLIDLSKQGIALDLVLFNADFTPTADNSPFDPSDGDMANFLCQINVAAGNYAAYNDHSSATVPNLNIPFVLTPPATTLYGQIVTRGTPTYVAGELTVWLHIEV